MKISAWMVGLKKDIIDGRIALDVNRKVADRGYVDAKLKLLGKDVFPEVHQEFHLAFETGGDLAKKNVPPVRPQFSYVIVTGSAWAELSYGAKVGVGAETQGSCDLSKLQFGASASMGPTFALNAKAQVGVGVSGVASAGIRGLLNLIQLSLPLKTSLGVNMSTVAGEEQPTLDFDLDLQLTLGTLSGYLALYIEFLLYEEEWELIRWNGVGPATISLLPEPIDVSLPLFAMEGK